ncbi:peptidase inhibitor family I36 protein [Streptomyces sp. TRM 70361]|uniref:peptidase inhibitor family I36 protein n=1 Tax=Streptomyces sp. TRM 70361 TaxID=3116553 RepID=UPI002E7AC2E9|nr:peptidase inhibitor family I36 protein [Streptomyces sp. TRM 70361]MEE1943291.1 peptidase inhibitor family I36 protein [Streptomyces sp. TRM 70361]
MRKTATALTGLVLALAGVAAVPGTAHAGDPNNCPSGYFCATTDVDYNGTWVNWYGDDGWWETNILNKDSSWINRGISGSGIPAHVRVYDDFWQTGAMTICLRPNDSVAWNSYANDRGSSHTWTHGC